jgi:hypothetical protein
MVGHVLLLVSLIVLVTLVLLGVSWGKILVAMACLWFIGIGIGGIIMAVQRSRTVNHRGNRMEPFARGNNWSRMEPLERGEQWSSTESFVAFLMNPSGESGVYELAGQIRAVIDGYFQVTGVDPIRMAAALAQKFMTAASVLLTTELREEELSAWMIALEREIRRLARRLHEDQHQT